jgi:ATP adenylyltransferase
MNRTKIHGESRSTRFAGALNRNKRHCEIFDTVLFETEQYVVVPTLGSVVPNWLLVVPRVESLNFARWEADSGQQVSRILDQVCEALDIGKGKVIWFEHGAVVPNSSIGCGVDRAHLHILVEPPFEAFDFLDLAVERCQSKWEKRQSIHDCYRAIDVDRSYFALGDISNSILAQDVEGAGSQFLRKLIAELSGAQDQWDYKKYPNLANISTTLGNYAGH